MKKIYTRSYCSRLYGDVAKLIYYTPFHTNQTYHGLTAVTNIQRMRCFKNLLVKYNKMGLPGISLLVKDANGAWCGVVGKPTWKKT